MRNSAADTRDADDTLALIRGGVLRGLSLEFSAVSERMEGQTRIVERAELRGLAVVDRPAYSDSLVHSAGRASAGRARDRRKISLQPHPCNPLDREEAQTARSAGGVQVCLGRSRPRNIATDGPHTYDRPLASKLSGTLRLEDTREALRFDVDTLPDTSYVADYRAAVASGAAVFGVDALFQIPAEFRDSERGRDRAGY